MTPFFLMFCLPAENSISLDTYRAKALILPPISTRKDNTNNQPPSNESGVLMRSETNDTVTPPFLLRVRRKTSLCFTLF